MAENIIKFVVGKTYKCRYFTGRDENGELVFDKSNPAYWRETTAEVLKRTEKTLTIQVDGWDRIYKPRIGIDGFCDREMIWTYEFRMYADGKA